MHQKSASQIVTANHDGSEDGFGQVRGDPEKIGQIAVYFINKPIVIPGLSRPEPLPTGSADEGPNNDHRDPKDDEAEHECADGKLALLPGVITAAQRVGVDVGNYHEPDDDQRRHHHAGNPRIEVHQHFLQAEEVPGRLRGIHREVGIRRLLKRRAQRNRPDHQNNCDDNGGEEFDAQEKWPDMDFLLPAGTEWPGFAMMSFRHRGIGFEFSNQFVVGFGLRPRQVNVKDQ